MLVSCVRSRGGVPPLHAAVPRGAAPRGAPPSRAPSSRGRGVQRARGAPPTAGYRPAPPIVQDTYGEYVSVSFSAETMSSHTHSAFKHTHPHTLVCHCSYANCCKHRWSLNQSRCFHRRNRTWVTILYVRDNNRAANCHAPSARLALLSQISRPHFTHAFSHAKFFHLGPLWCKQCNSEAKGNSSARGKKLRCVDVCRMWRYCAHYVPSGPCFAINYQQKKTMKSMRKKGWASANKPSAKTLCQKRQKRLLKNWQPSTSF